MRISLDKLLYQEIFIYSTMLNPSCKLQKLQAHKKFHCPHSVVTCIGSVRVWSEGPGFESSVGWLLRGGHIPVVPNWFNSGGVQNCLWLCAPIRGFPHWPQGLENMENREKNNGQVKVREFFPESLNAAISIINLLKISQIYRPTCISIPWDTHDLNITLFYEAFSKWVF